MPRRLFMASVSLAAFAASGRTPAASRIVAAAPHAFLAEAGLDSRSVVCLLSHDEDLDRMDVLAREAGPGLALARALQSLRAKY